MIATARPYLVIICVSASSPKPLCREAIIAHRALLVDPGSWIVASLIANRRTINRCSANLCFINFSSLETGDGKLKTRGIWRWGREMGTEDWGGRWRAGIRDPRHRLPGPRAKKGREIRTASARVLFTLELHPKVTGTSAKKG